MKRFKYNYKFLTILLCVVAVNLQSCSLDEEPITKLPEEDVFGDDTKIELVLSGLYTQWRNTRQDRGILYMELGTDEAKQGGQQVLENAYQASLDKYDRALNVSNTVVSSEWDKRWKIVAAAAKAVHGAVDEQLKAEATFIRAAVNFELTTYWGEIAINDLDNMRPTRQPLEDVYGIIISDLEYAVENLPWTQSDPKLPTKGAALALLGKVYMAVPEETGMRDYAKALDYFDELIPHYALVANYADLFDTTIDQNSSEVIYAFQFDNIDGDNNMVEHHAGSRAVADKNGNVYFGGYDLALPTEYYHTTVWEDQEGDTRKEASIRYDFTLPDGTEPTITWTGQEDELEPHTKKFEDPRTQEENQGFWYSGGNIYYLRLADILLMKAESLNELGRTGEAVSLVNTTVRARAFGGTLPVDKAWDTGMSQEEFRTQILDERMRELAFEGWRRIDLVRTGNFVDYISNRNPWAKASGTIQEFHKYFPIPESEIKQNEYINEEDQNPGY